MVLNCTLGSLAVLSLILLLWQWLAAWRFPLHRRTTELRFGSNLPKRSSAFQSPGVTNLKPLKGADENTELCLRSWLTQDYTGPVQTLFGVATADDPAAAVVRKLLAEFPNTDAQLLVCAELLGSNTKVAKLIQLERLAKHELICVSDADVRVPADFLTEAVRPLSPSDGERVPAGQVRGGAALVNCFYRLANPTTLAMQCEAVAINADFWSQVLQSCSLKPMNFALGAAMLVPRAELADIGGFDAIKDCLADDYQLGNRIAMRGGRIEISPVVVECWDAPAGWVEMWKHQLRWARTIRVCQPGPYFFSILCNPTFWPALWVGATFSTPSLIFLCVALAIRLLATSNLQRRLAHRSADRENTEAMPELADSAVRGPEETSRTLAGGNAIVDRKPQIMNPTGPPHVGGHGFWLAPVKDLMQVVVWAMAFMGNTVEWRGRRMKVRRDGTLISA